nr:MAG TPA: hypothetical protein [Bacteriophage sp.]
MLMKFTGSMDGIKSTPNSSISQNLKLRGRK